MCIFRGMHVSTVRVSILLVWALVMRAQCEGKLPQFENCIGYFGILHSFWTSTPMANRFYAV